MFPFKADGADVTCILWMQIFKPFYNGPRCRLKKTNKEAGSVRCASVISSFAQRLHISYSCSAFEPYRTIHEHHNRQAISNDFILLIQHQDHFSPSISSLSVLFIFIVFFFINSEFHSHQAIIVVYSHFTLHSNAKSHYRLCLQITRS